MFNIIKMDFYRMFKTVSFWVSLIVAVGISMFTSFIANLFEMPDMSAAYLIIQAFSSSDVLIICTIFISIFVHAESKNGFIKNIAGQVKPRSKLILPKLLILISYIIILPLVYFLFSILTFILVGNNIIFDFSIDIFMTIAVEFLLYFAFGSIIIMLCIISNSSALSIAVGIMMSARIFSIIYAAIDFVVSKINPGSTFTSFKYSLISNMQYVANMNDDSTVRAIFVGIAFAAAAIAISVLSIQKKDIK